MAALANKIGSLNKNSGHANPWVFMVNAAIRIAGGWTDRSKPSSLSSCRWIRRFRLSQLGTDKTFFLPLRFLIRRFRLSQLGTDRVNLESIGD